MRWFRFYDETVEDPKVQRLPDGLFKTWVNLLCIASKHGGELPPVDDIAFALRLSASKAAAHISALKAAGLIDGDETLRPHNWNSRQYQSDDSGNRVKRHRERKRNGECNVTETANETPPDTETDTETDSEAKASGAVAPPATKRGSRLPSDWVLTDEWREAAAEARQRHTLPAINLDLEAEKFANYWHAKSGQAGTKLDWKAAWINWALRADAPRNGAEDGKFSRAGNGWAKLATSGAV